MRNEKFEPDEYSDAPQHSKTSAFGQFGWDCRAEYRYEKRFNLHRWLRSHVGQKFSDVNSKYAKRKKDRGSYHYWDSLCECNLIELDCTVKDNKVYDTKGDEVSREFYVVDDILYEIKEERTRWRRPKWSESLLDKGIVHKNGRVFTIINSIWYELNLKILYSKGFSTRSFRRDLTPYDYYLQTSYSSADTRRYYYGDPNYYCSGKKQLNKQEIRKLNLREDERSE